MQITLSKLTIRPHPVKLTLPDLLLNAPRTTGFTSRVPGSAFLWACGARSCRQYWFFSRPELVPDEKGRHLPVLADKYTSAAFFRGDSQLSPGSGHLGIPLSPHQTS